MSELPSHTDTGTAPSEPAITPRSRRRKWLIITAAIALIVLFVVLHLTGVVGGTEGHG